MTRWYLGLGGNVGDVAATFAIAEQLLADHPQVTAVRRSRIYRTAPMGDHAGDEFLNAALEVATSLTPLELLDLAQSVEQRCGRVRTQHWGPRTLDVDLLLSDPPEVLDTARLTVPHPHLWYRRFVLEPLAELAPALVHPVYQRTVQEFAATWRQETLNFVVCGPDTEKINALLDQLQKAAHNHRFFWFTEPTERADLTLAFEPAASIADGVPVVTLPADVLAAERFAMAAITAATDAVVPRA